MANPRPMPHYEVGDFAVVTVTTGSYPKGIVVGIFDRRWDQKANQWSYHCINTVQQWILERQLTPYHEQIYSMAIPIPAVQDAHHMSVGEWVASLIASVKAPESSSLTE
ncbi:hypothetical protein [Anthocerotibacter panamensis]|uniref:hypothetical protein n=1 Tax=Anthocerotibacter panamensis TaxID=2857077 RepID=UPI001C4075FC|nr:hypothetical protein [Anthocerotibacter panamensis]